MIGGFFFSETISRALGADNKILPACNTYLKTILCFAPFFILNHLFMAFIRNDKNPKLSMATMLTGSFANIVLDYLFLYPLDMGIFGAALATALSPVIGLGISSIHLFSGRNQFHLVAVKIKKQEIRRMISLGLSTFINEFSSSVVLVVFNLLILQYAGNVGVAAYGIVANLALVVLGVFTGISHGIQPLLSQAYGKGDGSKVKLLYRQGLILSASIGIVILEIVSVFSLVLVSWFNSENNPTLQLIAENGLRLYFIGFLFVGYNFLTASLFSATEEPKSAFVISFFRGCVGIIAVACLFAVLFGMTGVWISFPAVELGTLCIGFYLAKTKGTRADVKIYHKQEQVVQD